MRALLVDVNVWLLIHLFGVLFLTRSDLASCCTEMKLSSLVVFTGLFGFLADLTWTLWVRLRTPCGKSIRTGRSGCQATARLASRKTSRSPKHCTTESAACERYHAKSLHYRAVKLCRCMPCRSGEVKLLPCGHARSRCSCRRYCNVRKIPSD